MGTRFEVIVAGQQADYARQAASAAFDELDRLEEALSRFIAYSDVSQINRLRAGQSVRVGPAAFECLELAARVHAETTGAFDVTIGPLLACWRADDGSPRTPSQDELAAARARTGMRLLDINEREHTIGVRADGVRIDLGGIGKGYAVDQIGDLLREWSIDVALIHGGESTALAMGSPPGENGWSLAIRGAGKEMKALSSVRLRNRALSGSGMGPRDPHIIDPRTGRPARGKLGAWAAAPSAALSDALSTAFMVMSADEAREYCRRHPDVAAMLAIEDAGELKIVRFGKWE